MKTTPADNSTFDNYGMTAAEVITLTVVSYFISSIGTMSNILVLFAVLLTRQLRESTTAVDQPIVLWCYHLCSVRPHVHRRHPPWRRHRPWSCEMASGLRVFHGILERRAHRHLWAVLYICYPYRYINWTSATHVAIAAFCAQWLPSLVLTLPLLVTSTTLYSFVYIVVVIAFISGLHVSIYMYCVARRESRKIARQYPAGSQTPRMPVWNKSVTAVAMAVMASLLCWAPVVFLPAIVSPTSPSFKHYIKIASAFTSMGAAIHPFIFCWKLRHFREALVNCLRKLRNVLCGWRWLSRDQLQGNVPVNLLPRVCVSLVLRNGPIPDWSRGTLTPGTRMRPLGNVSYWDPYPIFFWKQDNSIKIIRTYPFSISFFLNIETSHYCFQAFHLVICWTGATSVHCTRFFFY